MCWHSVVQTKLKLTEEMEIRVCPRGLMSAVRVCFALRILLSGPPVSGGRLPDMGKMEQVQPISKTGTPLAATDNHVPENTKPMQLTILEEINRTLGDINNVARISGELATDILQNLKETNPKDNVIISPYSSLLNLAILLEASPRNSSTAKQIMDALRINKMQQEISAGERENDQNSLRSAFSAIRPFFEGNPMDESTLSGGSAIFVDKSRMNELKAQFTDIVKNEYKGHMHVTNFKDPSSAVKQINNWAAKVTKDNVKSILSATDIDSGIKIMMTNALYYHGMWVTSFDPKLTFPEAFHLENEETIQVDMMHQRALMTNGYVDSIQSRLLEIPFRGNFTFLVVLPDESSNVKNTLIKMVNDPIESLRQRLWRTDVILSMPKFNITGTTNLDLVYQKLGIRDLFSMQADLSEMTTEKLHISKIMQTASMDISEKGAKASAATVDLLIPLAGFYNQQHFQVNRPFIYFLIHDITDVVLFSGIINTPITQRHGPAASNRHSNPKVKPHSHAGAPETQPQAQNVSDGVKLKNPSDLASASEPRNATMMHKFDTSNLDASEAQPQPIRPSIDMDQQLQSTEEANLPKPTATSTPDSNKAAHNAILKNDERPSEKHIPGILKPTLALGPFTLSPGSSILKITVPPELQSDAARSDTEPAFPKGKDTKVGQKSNSDVNAEQDLGKMHSMHEVALTSESHHPNKSSSSSMNHGPPNFVIQHPESSLQAVPEPETIPHQKPETRDDQVMFQIPARATTPYLWPPFPTHNFENIYRNVWWNYDHHQTLNAGRHPIYEPEHASYHHHFI